MSQNVTYLDHPLIQHKISMLRDIKTGTNEFRKLTEEIAMLMGYEALRDLPLEDIEVTTPLETCRTPMITGKKLAIVPILRAGLGMVNGILALTPTAKVGHIGLYRDHDTHEPHEYYCKLPSPLSKEPSWCWTRCWPPAARLSPQWILSRSTAVKPSNSCPLSPLRKG